MQIPQVVWGVQGCVSVCALLQSLNLHIVQICWFKYNMIKLAESSPQSDLEIKTASSHCGRIHQKTCRYGPESYCFPKFLSHFELFLLKGSSWQQCTVNCLQFTWRPLTGSMCLVECHLLSENTLDGGRKALHCPFVYDHPNKELKYPQTAGQITFLTVFFPYFFSSETS